jgi:hypothetical protein
VGPAPEPVDAVPPSEGPAPEPGEAVAGADQAVAGADEAAEEHP